MIVDVTEHGERVDITIMKATLSILSLHPQHAQGKSYLYLFGLLGYALFSSEQELHTSRRPKMTVLKML